MSDLLTTLEEMLCESSAREMFSLENSREGIVLKRCVGVDMINYERSATGFMNSVSNELMSLGYRKPSMLGKDRNGEQDFVLRFVKV